LPEKGVLHWKLVPSKKQDEKERKQFSLAKKLTLQPASGDGVFKGCA
jgi:hypothetical protein